MVIKIHNRKTFYTTKEEVEEVKKKGDRIYYVAGVGYYIIRPSKRGFFY